MGCTETAGRTSGSLAAGAPLPSVGDMTWEEMNSTAISLSAAGFHHAAAAMRQEWRDFRWFNSASDAALSQGQLYPQPSKLEGE